MTSRCLFWLLHQTSDRGLWRRGTRNLLSAEQIVYSADHAATNACNIFNSAEAEGIALVTTVACKDFDEFTLLVLVAGLAVRSTKVRNEE